MRPGRRPLGLRQKPSLAVFDCSYFIWDTRDCTALPGLDDNLRVNKLFLFFLPLNTAPHYLLLSFWVGFWSEEGGSLPLVWVVSQQAAPPFSSPALRSLHGRPDRLDLLIYRSSVLFSLSSPPHMMRRARIITPAGEHSGTEA